MRYLTEKDERRLAKLDALEAGGVDNWQFYGESLKDWHEENEKHERCDKFVDDLLEIILSECRIYEPSDRGSGYDISDKQPAYDFIFNNVEKFKD